MKSLDKITFYSYQPAAWLKVSGVDAASYLQGQFTNDLRGARQHSSIYGLWLNQKGKVVADSFVVKGTEPDEFFILSYFSTADVIRERLEAYIIADEVVIEDATAETGGISLIGPGAGNWLEKPPDGAVAFPGRRLSGQSVEWIFPNERRADISSRLLSLGLGELSREAVEYWRITAGIPTVPQDIGAAELPNEGALETTAISYTKGCYLGQEVMARLKSMGQVRRRLLRVEATTKTIPALPAALFADGRRVGELRSAALGHDGNLIGLALLSLMQLKPDTVLSFSSEGLPVLRIVEKP